MHLKALYIPFSYGLKFLFWFVFVNIALVQALICSQMWQNNSNRKIEIIVIIVYCVSFFAFLCGLFFRNKILSYISAILIITLFFWAAAQSELSSYFAFFNMDV